MSKAKAYLKRYESFESKQIYLDSAFFYLKKSENNFTSYIQYYYLKDDSKGLINFVMSNKVNSIDYTDSDLALAYSRMGEVFGENNLRNQAAIYHQEAISLMSLVIDYKLKYASFLFKNNQVNDAEQQYLIALSLNPTIKEIHANLGLIAILNEQYSNAETSLKQAIALDPDYILAYENLVLLSQKTNNYVQTEFYLNKILEIDPNHKIKSVLDNL